jgi:hypothetical protein
LQNRQADADLIETLRKEAAALSFGSHQDAMDYVRHSVEYVNRRMASQNLDAINRYVKGEVAAYVAAVHRRSKVQYHFVFRGIPSEGVILEVADASRSHVMGHVEANGCSSRPDFKGNEREVFFGISDFIESPEGVVASQVTLESFKDVTDFRWQILAYAGHPISEVRLGIAEGESDMLGGAVPSDAGGVSALVQDSAEVISGVEENTREFIRQLALKFDFVDMLRRIRVFIDRVGPRLTVFEFGDNPFEITDVMLCATESQARAIEHIDHVESRSDERPGISESGSPFFDHSPQAA